MMFLLFCLLFYPVLVILIAVTTNDKDDPRGNDVQTICKR